MKIYYIILTLLTFQSGMNDHKYHLLLGGNVNYLKFNNHDYLNKSDMSHSYSFSKNPLNYLNNTINNISFYFNEEEKNMILDKVDLNAYNKVIKELEKDNDYQSLQKILSYTNEHKYDQKDIDTLMHQIELLFMCDGTYDLLEKNMMMSLTKLLKHQNDKTLSS